MSQNLFSPNRQGKSTPIMDVLQGQDFEKVGPGSLASNNYRSLVLQWAGFRKPPLACWNNLAAAAMVAFLILAFTSASSEAQQTPARGQEAWPRAGDIVFQAITTPQTAALQAVTGSIYTHCGVVTENNGRFYVQETLLVLSQTPLEKWLARGNGDYVIMRLKQADQILTPEALAALNQVYQSYQGRVYDLKFQWTDDRLYCSELVYKMFEKALGLSLTPLKKIGDYPLNDPEVQKLIGVRFSGDFDLSEPAVSPADLMASTFLLRIR
ncbi:MAG: hypothetical protein LBT47_13995 [Deltaproteobacteria bacterium]|jgi:hypothetical protein|nr:hypothetical protein [Deltaproteobacteria bacterium]